MRHQMRAQQPKIEEISSRTSRSYGSLHTNILFDGAQPQNDEESQKGEQEPPQEREGR